MKKEICETCIYDKYDCYYMMGGNVKVDFKRKIIVGCDKYEDEAGGGKVYYNGDLVNFNAAVNLMDDEIRESVHRDLAPCTNQQFFNEYCDRHLQKYGTEFVYN
jgi:hypothetical protein